MVKKMTTCKDFVVWQRGIELVENGYELAKTLSFEERYALASQLQRAAMSVPSNLA